MLVEECINVIVMNSVNEVLTYMLTLYLTRKTYVTRASVYGIISSLFVILEGVYNARYKKETDHRWYITAFTFVEIFVFLTDTL